MDEEPIGRIARLLVAGLWCWATVAAAADPAVLQINYGAISAACTPVRVARDEGIFAKHGLTTDLKYVAAATEAQALLAGSLHIANAWPDLIDARLGGADVTYIAARVNRFVFSLYAQPKIQKLLDLKGRVVAATAGGAAEH